MRTKIPKRFVARNVQRGTVLASDGRLASSFVARLFGLMGRKALAEGGGLLLTSSSSIHSFFMRFRFDAVFLDREHRVVKIVPAMRPWRMAFGGHGAKHTLELYAGAAERAATQPGDEITFDEAPG